MFFFISLPLPLSLSPRGRGEGVRGSDFVLTILKNERNFHKRIKNPLRKESRGLEEDRSSKKQIRGS
jgi:hypothetical protein